MISLFLTTSYVLLRIRQTINSVDEVEINLKEIRVDTNWEGAFGN